MQKGPRTALIAEGSVSQSWISKLPGLRQNLGPVMSVSLRTASRVVNLLRGGIATNACADFRNCELILVAVPDAQLSSWVERILQHIGHCRKVAFVCCTNRLDSGSLAQLKERGAAVGSLSEMDGYAERRYLFEGDRIALHRLRRLIEPNSAARVVEINLRQRPVYEAGMTFATGMTFPMISAAVDSMKAAGLDPKLAENAVETAVLGALRSYLRAGKRGWAGPVARGDRDELKRQYQALFEVDSELAEMYLKIAVDYLAETAARPRSGKP